jgi:putative transposase
MVYDPKIHHRRSIRLKGYDYSRAGAYFVTLCAQNRLCLFGKVVDGAMQLNDAGQMVGHWYSELAHKFPDIDCDACVCMPNHIHFIAINTGTNIKTPGSPLPRVVQWFKTMTTNAYIRGVKQHQWPAFPGKLWQRSYYEHIIRDENAYHCIRNDILDNPMKWHGDRLNPDTPSMDTVGESAAPYGMEDWMV